MISFLFLFFFCIHRHLVPTPVELLEWNGMESHISTGYRADGKHEQNLSHSHSLVFHIQGDQSKLFSQV